MTKSAIDEFFDRTNDWMAEQDAKVQKLRDGTPKGELKADYLAALYRRKRLALGLRILSDTGVPESLRAEKREEIAAVEKTLAELEQKLDAAGIRVRKIRGDAWYER